MLRLERSAGESGGGSRLSSCRDPVDDLDMVEVLAEEVVEAGEERDELSNEARRTVRRNAAFSFSERKRRVASSRYLHPFD
jgi:hypothetical protein